MTEVITALDNLKKIQIGENKNLEYAWKLNFDELIVQYNFQLVRSSNLDSLKSIYKILLSKVFVENPDIKKLKQFINY